jgi:ABC-type polysaccharide/polyol phosphate export permease
MDSRLKIDSATRFFLLVVSILIWLGIWLTGFNNVHWILYVPAAFLLLAAILGVCPGMFFSRLLLKKGN